MRVRALVAAGLAASLLLPCQAQAQSTQRSKKRGKGKKAAAAAAWLLPDVSEVPGARELAERFPEADAVIVLDAIQHEWVDDHQLTRVQRRLVFLTEAGAQAHRRVEVFVPETAGPWIAGDGEARLVKAGGGTTTLDGVTTEAVDGGLRVSVGATGAAAGDLLELSQELESPRPSYPPWTVQGPLPVAESRLVAVPPPIVTLRAHGANLPGEALEPTAFEHGDLQAAGWRFRNLPALPDSPLSPPDEQGSGRLLLAVEDYPDLETGEVLQLDWPAWAKIASQAAAAWTEPGLAEKLSSGLGGDATPAGVLEALRGKLAVKRSAPWPEHPSAQAALDAASGNSADFALLAAAVLKAAGAEDVELVAARAASRGVVASASPVDGNFSELLVRAGDSWLDPAGVGSVGPLPARFLGTLHAPLRTGLSAPLPFAEALSSDNVIERKARLTLSPEGRLSGSSTWAWSPMAAALAGTTKSKLDRPVDRPGWGRRKEATMTYGVLPWRVLQDLDLSGPPPPGILDLGLPRTVVDEIAVDLPPGVTGAKLAAPATIDAGPAGSYERTVKPDGRTVTVTRIFRLDVTRFGADEVERLFTWLRRIQESERAETRLQFE
jgi:hypothetical protein